MTLRQQRRQTQNERSERKSGNGKRNARRPDVVVQSGADTRFQAGIWESESRRDGISYSWSLAFVDGDKFRKSFELDEIYRVPELIQSLASFLAENDDVDLDDKVRVELSDFASSLNDTVRLAA